MTCAVPQHAPLDLRRFHVYDSQYNDRLRPQYLEGSPLRKFEVELGFAENEGECCVS